MDEREKLRKFHLMRTIFRKFCSKYLRQYNHVPTTFIIGSNFTVSDPRSEMKCVAYSSAFPFTTPEAKTITFVQGKTF